MVGVASGGLEAGVAPPPSPLGPQCACPRQWPGGLGPGLGRRLRRGQTVTFWGPPATELEEEVAVAHNPGPGLGCRCVASGALPEALAPGGHQEAPGLRSTSALRYLVGRGPGTWGTAVATTTTPRPR